MGKCSYEWKEWIDSMKYAYVEKRCSEGTWEGSDEFCIFHDPSPEKDEDLFKKAIISDCSICGSICQEDDEMNFQNSVDNLETHSAALKGRRRLQIKKRGWVGVISK